MKKDPAVLFYIDTWLSATAEMDSDVRGWYLNLILHNYDKKTLPNDIEKLALLAGVKFSEFERFKQMFEQVLKQKFEQNEDGRLENSYTKNILQSRENFKDKREKSGTIGYIVKLAGTIKGVKDPTIKLFKEKLYLMDTEEISKYKNKQVLEQMLKQMLELYKNENKNENINKDNNIDYNKLIEYFNSVTGKKIRVITESAKKGFKKILEVGYTKEDIMTSIENCFKDEFHQKNPHYLTLDFISRMEKFQKYLDCTKIKVKLPEDWTTRYLSEDQKKLLSKEQLSNWNTYKNRIEMEGSKMKPILN